MKMTLELNLVLTQNIYGSICESLNRQRYFIEDDSQALEAMSKFLGKNMEYLASYIDDDLFLTRLTSNPITVNDYASLRYKLGENGLDLLAFVVAEQEINATAVPAGFIEYNIIDTYDHMTSMLDFCTKLSLDSDDIKLGSLYSKIASMYDLFDSNLFASNPLVEYTTLIATSETSTGITPTALTNQVSQMLNFLGKRMIAIVNSDSKVL